MRYRSIVTLTLLTITTGLCMMTMPARAALGPEGQPAPESVAQLNTPAGPVNITDAEGNPLTGVTLSTQPPPVTLLPESISDTTVTQTNESGAFNRPPAEVPGVYFLLRKPGYETRALNAARPLPANIRMQPGRTINGTIFSADGQPIAGAVAGPVYETDSRGTGPNASLLPRMAVRTGADGTFTLPDLPQRPLQVQLWAPGYAPRFITFDPDQNDQKIALAKANGVIRGTVLGSKDRAPQAGIPVEARSRDNLLVYATTDANGAYSIDNLTEGTWYVRPAGGGPMSGTQSRSVPVEIASGSAIMDVPLVLNQGVMLAGRAVDAVTSRPLPGINITLAGYAGRGARAVLTQPDGSFEFENLDSMQDVIIRFDPVRFVYLLPNGAYRDYFDISQVSDTDFDVTTLTLPLHRRQPLQGNVTDTEGKAVADVQVHMQALDTAASAPSKSGPNLLTFATQSNGEGNFTAGVYPPGRYKVWAQTEELVSQVETVDAFTTAPEPKVQLRLDQPAQLSGTVTDARDRPVTGAIVIAWPANAPAPTDNPPIPGRETYAYARSDKDANFTLSGLRGEPLTLRAVHQDYFQAAEMEVDPRSLMAGSPDTTTAVALKFPAGGEFTVHVTDDQGKPLSQAEVVVEYRTGLEGSRASVHTNRYGSAFGGAIPADQLEGVTIHHPMFASFKQNGPIPLPINGITIALKKRSSLVATVHGESMYPGVTPEVFLLRAPITDDAAVPPENTFDQANRAQVTAGRVTFPSIPEGWYKVAFADSGSYAESEVVKVEAGGAEHHVSLTLPEGNILLGVVTDKASGDPIPGANITLRPAVQNELVSERATQNITADSEGTFQLHNMGTGQFRIRVIAANYPDYERTINFDPNEPIHIELTNEPATVTGRVLAGDQPVDGALLILATAGETHAPVATATTDESGHYQMDGFPAGSYTLSVEAPIGEGDNISRKSVTMELDAGANTQDLEFASLVSVNGRVRLNGQTPTRSASEPIALLFTGTEPGMESKMVTLDSGNYTTQLEPGDYTVSLDDLPGKLISIHPGNSQTLNLEF